MPSIEVFFSQRLEPEAHPSSGGDEPLAHKGGVLLGGNIKYCKYFIYYCIMKIVKIIIISLLLFVFIVSPYLNVLNADSSKDALQTSESRAAIERGLIYLAKNQREDGAWCDGKSNEHVSAITALALIAFFANGHVYDKGPYGKKVKKGLDYILDNCIGKGGFIGQSMYHHGFTTLALTEAYGMTKRKDILAKLKEAVTLIVETQNSKGGWRYQPKISDDDLSVTSAQIQALRAARDVGISVPVEVMQKAAKYIKNCACPDGGFAYQPRGGGSGIARTGAGMLSLMACGEYDCQEVKNGINYMLKNNRPDNPWDYYGFYYGVQAMYQQGGEDWKKWFPQVRDLIVKQQNPDGSFRAIGNASGPIGKCFYTATGVIILSVSNSVLPLFQR